MLSLFFAVGVLAQTDVTTDAADVAAHQSRVEPMCAHAHAGARSMMATPLELLGVDPNILDQTDVLNYKLELEIVPGSTTLIGTNRITVRCLVNAVTTFPLQLHQNFAMSIQIDPPGPAVTWTRQDVANVTVNLNQTFNANDEFDLIVSYSGVPSSGGFGSINFTTQNGLPLVFTLSEPYYSHTWWPVKEDNRDKATADLAFTVPNPMSVASNGIRQGVDAVAGNKSRYRWRTDYLTTPYLFSFSASTYNEFTDVWTHPLAPPGGMLMQFFIYPNSDTTNNRNAWLLSKQMLTTFTDMYSVYPFALEKYGIYQFGFSGGMEHQTMTGQGTFGESLTAHELAHQWWGDKITCETWGDIWLNEGFATYSEALWFEFKPGSTGTAALLTAMANRRPFSMNVTVFRYNTSSAGSIFSSDAVYKKGSWVLHMLRHIIGDDAFFEAVNTYGEQYAYSTAVTEDFQAIVEDVHGSSLEWFFQPWIYETGAPTYQTGWRNVSAGGIAYVELYIRQVQNESWPTFAMPIDIRTTANAVNTNTTVWNDERTEHLLFPAPGNVPITALAVDPDNYILHPTNQTTAFVEGPPKIVHVSPVPGSESLADAITAIDIVFHRNVNTSAAHFSVTGNNVGSLGFAFSYDAPSMTATLTFGDALPVDTYSVVVSHSVTNAIGGASLDGEIAVANNPASLPSGDGLPGGAAAYSFKVVSIGCAEDLSNDGLVGVPDLLAVINAWGPCASCPADIAPPGGDGTVGVPDLLTIINAWGPCE